MCQINSKPVEEGGVKGYRVYRWRKGCLVSYFNRQPKPRIGVWTNKRNEQFHAFCSVPRWAKNKNGVVIYLVELENNIQRGLWTNNLKTHTYTADRMKILRRIK